METQVKNYSAIHKLRINVKSLAEEAKQNRAEMKRTSNLDLKNELTEHRRGPLRAAARYAQLSMAYLRGRPYKEVENTVREGNEPSASVLQKKLARFDHADVEEVSAWLRR
jgi:hypothetical protein